MKVPALLRGKFHDSEPTNTIENTAAYWLVRRHEGFTAEEADAFRQWHSADQCHAKAFAKLEATWLMLSQPRASGQAGAVLSQLAVRARTRARRNVYALGSALAMAVALVFALRPVQVAENAAVLRTTVVQRPDLRTLPDGSTLELNAGAVFEVSFTAAKRSVRLIRGEAIFTVAKDAARPFVVMLGDIQVRAVGTAFCVRYDPKKVDVLVTEGTVSVAGFALNESSRRQDSAQPAVAQTQPAVDRAKDASEIFVTAGRRARLLLAVGIDIMPEAVVPQIVPLSFAEIQQELAWRGKRLEFTGTPLSEAIAWFNRQNRLQISVAERSILNLQITGIYWADDPNGFASLLEAGFNIKAERSEDSIVLR